MSNTASPYGLSYYEFKGGKDKGSMSTYNLPSGYGTSLGQGDPVNTASLGFIQAYTAPTSPTSPNPIDPLNMTLGVFVKVEYVNTQGQLITSNYWPGGTSTYNGQNAIVTVQDLPLNVYKIQCVGSFSGLTSPNTTVFQNYNIVAGTTPNPQTGQSIATLDNSSSTTSPNYWLTCKIVALAPALPGQTNSWYDNYPDVLVVINNHPYKYGTNGTN